MSTLTTRLGLTKPAGTENLSRSIINTNWDAIDAAVSSTVCTSSTRPGSPFDGQVIKETDTGRAYIWMDSVSQWRQIPVASADMLSALGYALGSSTTNAIYAKVSGDSQNRWMMDASGLMLWGSGSAAGDTNLYRSAANTLKTDDSFVVGGAMTVTGSFQAGVYTCRLGHSTTQSLSNGVSTAVTFNTEHWDNDTMHNGTNPTRITFTHAGLYYFQFGGLLDSGFSDYTRAYAVIKLNGTDIVSPRQDHRIASMTGPSVQASGVWPFTAGQYIEAYVIQNNGASAARNISIGTNESPEFMAVSLGTYLTPT